MKICFCRSHIHTLGLACIGLALTLTLARAADPQLESWQTGSSRRYARLYETDAAKSVGTAVTTWSRGQGVQSTPSYAGVIQVSSSANWVYLRSSGLGYHVMGPWYLNAAHTQNFPNFPANTGVLYRIPRAPVVATTRTLTPGGPIGYFVDGVSVFDNRDTFSYSNARGADADPGNGARGDGVWNRDAYVNEGMTFDAAFAHQAGSNYHYHANTPALRFQLGDHVDFNATTRNYTENAAPAAAHSPILGWMADGFPVYGPYGYSSPLNAASGVRRMVPGYGKRDGTNGTTNLAATGRTTLPAWAARAQNRSTTLAANVYGPAVNADYILGHFIEDYDYLGDLGKVQGADFDLNECNVRFCVTPEFPNGTYAYFLTIESDGTPKFPFIIGRWFYGNPTGGSVNAISESVTEFVRASQASPLRVSATNAGGTVAVVWSSVEGATYRVESSPDASVWTTLAAAVLSRGGDTTTYSTSTVATHYRVTLTALAVYDTRGAGGLTGVGNAATATTPVGTNGTARLVNLATRVQVGGSAGTPTAGFVLAGEGAKEILLRAVGPGLNAFQVQGVLANPSLSLVSGGATVAGNDDWTMAVGATFAAAGAFALEAGSKDAALSALLPAGAYSAVIGAGGGSGVTLLEVYSPESAGGAALVNASTRAFVGTGDSVLIPGFVVSGAGSVKLLLRAAGPALGQFGENGALADPQITLYAGATVVGSNDNWSAAANAAEIAEVATNAGAFAFASGSKDAALLATLPAGQYTAIVSGVGNTSGNVLVELYVIP